MRISVTWLESFRLICETEWGNEAELIAQIKGEPFKPTWQMQAGSAWDLALGGVDPEEAQDAHQGRILRYGDFWFDAEKVALARVALGPGLHQVKATVPIGGPGVTLVGVADHIHGDIIQDNKAKFSGLDVKWYEPSLQWRSYLYLFGAAHIRYNFWEFREPDGGGYCELRNISSCRFWPYPALERELREWIRRFTDWADSKELVPYQKEQP